MNNVTRTMVILPLSRLQFLGLMLVVGWQFLFTSSAHADYPLKIVAVKVGLPPGPISKLRDENNLPLYLFKAGLWAPVAVDLEIINPSFNAEKIEFTIEAPDDTDLIVRSKRTVPFKPASGTNITYNSAELPCVKLGGLKSEVTVRVRAAGTDQELAAPFRARVQGLPTSKYLVLGAGGGYRGFRLPKTEGSASESFGEATEPLRNGWVELATLSPDSLAFPTKEGLAAVDVLIFSGLHSYTAWETLNDVYPVALSNWVASGGHLVVSVGKNAEWFGAKKPLVGKQSPLVNLLPVNIVGRTEVATVPMVLPNSPRMVIAAPPNDPLSVAKMEPKAGTWHTVRLSSDDAVRSLPLVVQGSYGLGRVTVVLFDLEAPPVVEWKTREAFWEWLLNTAGPKLPTGTERLSDSLHAESEDEYLELMHVNLDTFEGVPVISFSWVAFLMLGYLLLIGPIERYLLRRFLGRLEWTWLTVPLIVGGVCAFASTGAHRSKSKMTKINKIDLVDIDLQSNKAYGRSWFTLFSPKIQDYNIECETAWLSDPTDAEFVMSWHGQVRGNRQTLFRRSYELKDHYGALDGVPLQAWSTKEMGCEWSQKLPSTKPLFHSELRIAEGDPNQITGSLTSNLPVEILTDAVLIYRDRVTPLPGLLPGLPRYVSTSPQSTSATAWLLNASDFRDPSGSKIGKSKSGEQAAPTFRLWPVLQQELILGQFAKSQNAALRNLDQSWRVPDKNPHQAILLARIGTTETTAKVMNLNPAVPTRLKLQGSTVFEGTMRQETYIRVMIPIPPARSPRE